MKCAERQPSPEGSDAPAAVPRTVALIVAVTMFMGILEGTVIATALPHMAGDFGVRPVEMSIGISVYLITSAIFLPTSSWFAERFGTRRVMTCSIVGFAMASLLCGASTSLAGFVAARAVQALCSSLMVPVGNLVLLRVTPKRDLVSIMAISTTPALIAPVIGPPLGGFITSFFGWRWIFYLNLPIAVIGAVLTLRYIPDLRALPKRFDVKGFALTACALTATLYGLERLAAQPMQWELPLLLLMIGGGAGVMALAHARRGHAPLVSVAPLRHPTFASIAIGAGFFARLPFMAQAFILPLFFQVGFGLSAFQTGLLLLAQNAGDLALKPIAGKVLRWMGFRTALTSGSAMMMLSLAGCALLTPDVPFAFLFAALFATGMCRSVLFTAMMALTFADVADEELGVATVLNSLATAVTAALGVSLAALALNLSRMAGAEMMGDLADFRIAMLSLLALGALSIPLFARLPGDAGAEVSGQKLSPQHS
jgi:EmrB/QacA subfamily drug resistance transporter